MNKTVKYDKSYELSIPKDIETLIIKDKTSQRAIPLVDYSIGDTRTFSINGELVALKVNKDDYGIMGMVRSNTYTMTFRTRYETYEKGVLTMKVSSELSELTVKQGTRNRKFKKVTAINAEPGQLVIELDDTVKNETKEDFTKEYEAKLKALEDSYKKQIATLQAANAELKKQIDSFNQQPVDSTELTKLKNEKEKAEALLQTEKNSHAQTKASLKQEKADHKATKALLKQSLEEQLTAIKTNNQHYEDELISLADDVKTLKDKETELQAQKDEVNAEKERIEACIKVLTVDIDDIKKQATELKARFASDDALSIAMSHNSTNWIELDVTQDVDDIKKAIETLEGHLIRVIEAREKVNTQIVDLQTTNNNDGTITTEEEIGR